MATPRSPSFYTNFFRAVRSCQPTTYQSIRSPPTSSLSRGARGVNRRLQSTYPNRYGPAATEGLPPPPKPSEPLEAKQVEPEPRSKPKESEKQEAKSEPQIQEEQVNSIVEKSDAQEDAVSQEQVDTEKLEHEYEPEKELNMVLQVPAPSEIKAGKTSRHPHLEPSPYEHHFDTYSLVQQLSSEDSAFTLDQATTLMKAIRLQLALNLELAKDGLVSKSDIENESYLFRAACSELRTTLQTSRFAENQRQRTSRAHLQHEFDILNQKVNQDILTMREELKGMFNDRKMGLQEEKRKVDSQISELNYEITVLLNSEAKSEVEGLRWVLTRRAAMAIGTAACKFKHFPFHLLFFHVPCKSPFPPPLLKYRPINSL